MFNFRLQRILELREKAEQAKARELAAAQDVADSARAERDALADHHAASRAEVESAHHAEPRVGHLQQLGLVMQSLDERLESAGETVRAADEKVDDAQKLLEAAARDRRVLDRLKVRHTDQWRVEEAHKDLLGMDEIALSRFSRNADARTTEDAATRARSDDGMRNSTKNDRSTP
jgi:flagellar FliJ protein